MMILSVSFGVGQTLKVYSYPLKDANSSHSKTYLNDQQLIFIFRIAGEASAKTENSQALVNYNQNWPYRGGIEFQNYSARYRPNLPLVLKNLKLYIQPGEKVTEFKELFIIFQVGIVGRTGSGKSTLFLSLLRIIEADCGTILIDGIDTSQLGLDELRRKITIIPQVYLFFKLILTT